MSTMLGRLQGAWNAFWFRPGAATNLAAARIIVGAHALWILLSRDLASISGLPAGFWAGVPLTSEWRYLLFADNQGLEQLAYAAAVVALLGVIVGVATRVSCLAAALLLYHLAPLETIIWTPNPYERGFEISVLALVVLAISPCADAWSVRSSLRASGEPVPPAPSPAYHWPLMAIQVFIAQVYLFSGYAKLYRAGWGWVSSDNIRRWLLVFNQQDQIAVFDRLGPWLADRPALTLAVAVAAITLDLGFAAVLFWPRSRAIIVGAAVLFHAGILLSMNIAFLNLPQLLVFADWNRLIRGERAS